MKKLLSLCCFILFALAVTAQDEGYIMIDGLYYHYNDYAVSLCPLPDGEYYKGDIYVPDYVTVNGQQREVTSGWTRSIFHNCVELTSVSLPPTFEISHRFQNNPQLEYIHIRGEINYSNSSTGLEGINIWKVKLLVDEGKLDYYQSKSPYFLFHNIEEYNEPSAIKLAALSNKLGKVRYYNLKGQEVTSNNKGVTIIVTESGSTYKVSQK